MNNIEQRQRYYEHLLSIGMPDILAASMAAQANDLSQRRAKKVQAIFGFASWRHTKEGLDFWLGMADL